MSCDVKLYIGNSNVVQLGTANDPLANSVTGTADTGATVTVTIKDMDGSEITGETWPASLTHDGSGIYRRTLASDIALTENETYQIIIDATGSGGEVGKWTVERKAEVRLCE